MFKGIKNKFLDKSIKLLKSFRKEEELPFIVPSAIINFSPEAVDEGLTDQPNKIITVFEYNLLGNLTERRIQFSESAVWVLEKVRKIPVHDNTKGENRYPVYSRIDPSEISYLSK